MIVGRQYRHFKGNVYTVLGVSKPLLARSRRAEPILYTCQHSEVPGLEIHVCEGFVHEELVANCDLVIYESDHHEHWARPVESWNSLVDETPRFELLPEVKPPTPEELRKLRFGSRKLPDA